MDGRVCVCVFQFIFIFKCADHTRLQKKKTIFSLTSCISTIYLFSNKRNPLKISFNYTCCVVLCCVSQYIFLDNFWKCFCVFFIFQESGDGEYTGLLRILMFPALPFLIMICCCIRKIFVLIKERKRERERERESKKVREKLPDTITLSSPTYLSFLLS